MSRLLLALLTRFFRLGAAPEDATHPPEPAPNDPPAPETDDPSLEDLLDADEPAPARAEPEEDVATLRVRARELERQLREERERAVRSPAPAPAAPQGRDAQEEAEEAAYREAERTGSDPGYLKTLRWTIDSNRTIRKAERTSQAALAEARDIADRAEFASLASAQPKLYARYREQVESAAQQAKANGSPIPRMVLLDLAVGRAIREGKAVKTTKPRAAATPERADRGRAPLAGARTDVSGKEKQSEREARLARLEGIRI